MKAIKITTKIFLIFLILCSQAFGQYSWPESESYKQKTIDKKSGVLRSNLTRTFKKISDNRYLLKNSGKGDYSRFEDIIWTLESETELRGDLLCPLYTIITMNNSDDQMIAFCKKEFDYHEKKIHITQKDYNNKKAKKFDIPFDDPTTDYATMIYFLRPFINDLISGETIRFNFMSSEPGIYKLKARFIKEDILLVGSQEIETIKIAIRPDMGAFNTILDRFVPPTLLWFSKKEPHEWLKYEGLESGRGSAHIITTVEEIIPFKKDD